MDILPKPASEPIPPATNGNGNGNGDSKIIGVSLRAWLAVLLTVTVCIMSGLGLEITEPLYTMSVVAIGFYFGQKTK